MNLHLGSKSCSKQHNVRAERASETLGCITIRGRKGVILLWNVAWWILGDCLSCWCQCWCKDFRNWREGRAVPPEWRQGWKSSWQLDLSSLSWLAQRKDRTEKLLNTLKEPSQHPILGDQESYSLMETEIMRGLGNAWIWAFFGSRLHIFHKERVWFFEQPTKGTKGRISWCLQIKAMWLSGRYI